jgi:hypothetical protein
MWKRESQNDSFPPRIFWFSNVNSFLQHNKENEECSQVQKKNPRKERRNQENGEEIKKRKKKSRKWRREEKRREEFELSDVVWVRSVKVLENVYTQKSQRENTERIRGRASRQGTSNVFVG